MPPCGVGEREVAFGSMPKARTQPGHSCPEARVGRALGKGQQVANPTFPRPDSRERRSAARSRLGVSPNSGGDVSARQSFQSDRSFRPVSCDTPRGMRASRSTERGRILRLAVAMLLASQACATIQVVPGYWEKLQSTSERQVTLAGYRIADLILAAASQIEGQRKFVGR